MTNTSDLIARIEALERRLSGKPAGTSRAEIWFLLDRSGSMESIASDVVGGFDQFLADQRKLDGETTMTLVQFDSHDPHEVLVDARPLAGVRSIARHFRPRGSTPLYDAIGLLLDRAERRHGNPADQLVVIYTDGLENASRVWTAEQVFARVTELKERGWTFVFLGANQDSYVTGAHLAMAAGNTANFKASPDGVRASYQGLSRTTREWRAKERAARMADRDIFWGGKKESEEAE
jgi:Mg-chelatase subunit ChlD